MKISKQHLKALIKEAVQRKLIESRAPLHWESNDIERVLIRLNQDVEDKTEDASPHIDDDTSWRDTWRDGYSKALKDVAEELLGYIF